MSTNQPPNPYFNNINFNPTFFSSEESNYLTEINSNNSKCQISKIKRWNNHGKFKN